LAGFAALRGQGGSGESKPAEYTVIATSANSTSLRRIRRRTFRDALLFNADNLGSCVRDRELTTASLSFPGDVVCSPKHPVVQPSPVATAAHPTSFGENVEPSFWPDTDDGAEEDAFLCCNDAGGCSTRGKPEESSAPPRTPNCTGLHEAARKFTDPYLRRMLQDSATEVRKAQASSAEEGRTSLTRCRFVLLLSVR
jgi:hypothetical protein